MTPIRSSCRRCVVVQEDIGLLCVATLIGNFREILPELFSCAQRKTKVDEKPARPISTVSSHQKNSRCFVDYTVEPFELLSQILYFACMAIWSSVQRVHICGADAEIEMDVLFNQPAQTHSFCGTIFLVAWPKVLCHSAAEGHHQCSVASIDEA